MYFQCSRVALLTSLLHWSPQNTSWGLLLKDYEETRNRSSWADRSDSPPFFIERKSPGRGIQLHQKLSSPAKKKVGAEFIMELEEKQEKAQRERDRILEEKAQRSRTVSEKVLLYTYMYTVQPSSVRFNIVMLILKVSVDYEMLHTKSLLDHICKLHVHLHVPVHVHVHLHCMCTYSICIIKAL